MFWLVVVVVVSFLVDGGGEGGGESVSGGGASLLLVGGFLWEQIHRCLGKVENGALGADRSLLKSMKAI